MPRFAARGGNVGIRMVVRIEGPGPECELGPSSRGMTFSPAKSNFSSEAPSPAYVAPVVSSTP
jgi:hypothetical protein